MSFLLFCLDAAELAECCSAIGGCLEACWDIICGCFVEDAAGVGAGAVRTGQALEAGDYAGAAQGVARQGAREVFNNAAQGQGQGYATPDGTGC